MSKIHLAAVKSAAEHSGIPDCDCAAYILKSMLELKSNGDISQCMDGMPRTMNNNRTIVRKFNSLLQGFILFNYHTEFQRFCTRNEIFIFNDDLEFDKKAAVFARFIFIIFLREEIKLRPPIKIVP